MPVSPEDAEIIIQEMNKAHRKIAIFLNLVGLTIPSLLDKLPTCAKKYTLQELIDLFQLAHENGRIP